MRKVINSIKEYLRNRFSLLYVNLLHTFQTDTAYYFNNIFNLVGTLVYSATFILFFETIFSNTSSIAGYSKSEVYIFMMVAEFSFMFILFWSIDAITETGKMVNNGNLDLVLAKPVPSLFYVTFQKLSPMTLLREGPINIAILVFLIDWRSLSIKPDDLIAGIFIFGLGQIALNAFQFLAMIPVFWLGESKSIIDTTWGMMDHHIPLEGLPESIKVAFTIIFPTLISAAIPVSVILGKTDYMLALPLVLVITIVFTFLKNLGWRMGLRSYTSASS